MTIRTRNAPSPTGTPHIGNSRTALYDYLLAKKYDGNFILRIEDTDQKRYVEGATEKIYEIHDFLGLVPDEDPRIGGPFEPYIQTERLELYQKYAQQLVNDGYAYEDEGAIRVKMPKEGFTTWKDLVQGKISIPNNEVDNKVLMKSNGIPTYHLAVVVDDHLMDISHILRGVEWISSTPVHLFLYQAFGWEPPIIGHLPLILGPDKSKLSKRHGAKSVLEYRDDGYLSEAINNFLFYLGFSYQDNSALLTLEEMTKVFDENRLQKQNAIFDIKKLDYFNSQWIRKLPVEELTKRLSPFIDYQIEDSLLSQIVPLAQPRLNTLKEFAELTRYFIERPLPPAELNDKKSNDFLVLAKEVIERVDWDKESIEENLQKEVDQKGYNRGEFFMVLRLAVTGRKVTPPLTESMLILGRDEVLARLSQIASDQ